MTKAREIVPLGPFELAAARATIARWEPVARFGGSQSEPLRLAFLLDGDLGPAAVAVTEEAGHLLVTADREPAAAARQLARMLSLDHDGTDYPAVGRRDPAVGVLMAALPGLRPVCFGSPYEAAAWAVLSQRISMRQAAGISARLVRDHGSALTVADGAVGCFPGPHQLLGVEQGPGLTDVKVARLHSVARATLDGRLDVDRLQRLGPVGAPEALRELPGIGPFWSSGIYLRSCGVVDVFPAEPHAVEALARLHGLGDNPDPGTLTTLTNRFAPFRMWVCFLLRIAAGAGLIPGAGGRRRAS